MKTDFSSPEATAEFSQFAGILSAALSQHHLSGFEIAQLEFHHLHYLCSYFILEGSKITADGDFSPEIKRCLLLGRKVMINLESTLKSRDITLPTKVHLVKVMVFPVVMSGCESWTVKKAEHRSIDAFEL